MVIYRWIMQHSFACGWLVLLLCAYGGVHIYVFMLVCTFMCIFWWAHICAYVGVHVYVHMLMCTFMCICSWLIYVHMLVYTFMYICWWAHICAHVCVHINSKHNARFESHSNTQLPNYPITQPPVTTYKLCPAAHISRASLQRSIPKLVYLQRRAVIPQESWISHENFHFRPINVYPLLILSAAVRVIKSRRMR